MSLPPLFSYLQLIVSDLDSTVARNNSPNELKSFDDQVFPLTDKRSCFGYQLLLVLIRRNRIKLKGYLKNNKPTYLQIIVLFPLRHF